VRVGRLVFLAFSMCCESFLAIRFKAFLLITLPTEEEASLWLTPGSPPWYFAQGLTPPAVETAKSRGEGDEGVLPTPSLAGV
jgi:hypothetical protein